MASSTHHQALRQHAHRHLCAPTTTAAAASKARRCCQHTRLSNRRHHTTFSATASQSAACSSSFPLESACSVVNSAAVGTNPLGYRGLIATADIPPGDLVLRIPLHNMLQVPRQLPGVAAAMQQQQQQQQQQQDPNNNMAAVTAQALETWQRQHWTLPDKLAAFLQAPTTTTAADGGGVVWESKLVAWLLYLQAAAPEGSLWRSYCRSLPAAEDAITFCSYSEQQAEQLQFSTWKSLADRQRQLLQTVQQQCEAAGLQEYFAMPSAASPTDTHAADSSSSSNDNSQQARSPDYAWALSMVKSRTFGQRLPAVQPGAGSSSSSSHKGAATDALALAAAAGGGELEGGDDDSDVFLLMAPFIDLVNHDPHNNCGFGIDEGGSSFSVRCSSSSSNRSSSSSSSNRNSSSSNSNSPADGILQGQEITISYGSNKSNLALLSCYGFQIPANPNDVQLLAPIFRSCLAAAGDGVEGFPEQLLQAAANAVAMAAADDAGQQQQQQNELLRPDLVAGRRRCAVAAMPVQPQPSAHKQQRLLQQLRYLAQLMIYQVGLIFKCCGTSIEDDLALLSELQGSTVPSSTDSSSSSGVSSELDRAIQQQAMAARLEHKLLLRECERLLRCVLTLLEDDLPVAGCASGAAARSGGGCASS